VGAGPCVFDADDREAALSGSLPQGRGREHTLLPSSGLSPSQKNLIRSLEVNEQQVTDPGLMASAAFDFYDGIFGTGFSRTRRFDLSRLGLPQLQLHSLETLFSEDEVWAVIRDLPCDKAPGPDGLTGAFYKKAWPIIKGDLLNAFNAFWAQDARSFHLLNDAYLVLVAKKEQPEGIGDYRPISLIHSFGKLITKCLANRLAPVLGRLVLPNQSAFIKGRCLYDNVRDVQLACRAIQKEKLPVSCSR